MSIWVVRWRKKLAEWLSRFGLCLPGKVMYIGGSDTLPAPLSREEEGELIARLEQGDEQARNQLIEHNLRLVAHIVKKYNGAAETDGYEIFVQIQ